MKQWQKQIKWTLYFWIGASLLTCLVYARLDWGLWPDVLTTSLLWYFNFSLLSFPLYWITVKIPFEQFPRPLFLMIHFLAALAFAAISTELAFLDLYLYPNPGISNYLNSMHQQFFYLCTIFYAAVVSWFYFLHYVRRSKEQAVRETYLKQLAQEAELKALKAQVNPHFLFNSLNSINSLVVNEPEKAREMISALADILRYVLDTSQRDMVSLEEEINFVKTYLAIEKIRFGDYLQFEIQIDPQLNKMQIPPVILQPLVENSIKHGISNRVDSGKIIIHVSTMDKNLFCQVIDTGKGLNQKNGNGVGIKNIKERLKMIYGNSFSFSIKDNSKTNPKGCITTIRIPIE